MRIENRFDNIKTDFDLSDDNVKTLEDLNKQVIKNQESIRVLDMLSANGMLNQNRILDLRNDYTRRILTIESAISSVLSDCDLIICTDCDSIIWRDDSYYTYNGDRICESCFENEYFTCDKCGEIFGNDSMVILNDGGSSLAWCESCFDSYGFTCSDCNDNQVSLDNMIELGNGDLICTCCLENGNYNCCDDCGSYYPSDYINYNEDDDAHYCDNCYPSDDGEFSSHRQQVTFKDCKYSRTLPNKIYTSIEIESEFMNNDYDDDISTSLVKDRLSDIENIQVVSDGSLSNGVECVVSCLYGKNLIDTIKAVCSRLKGLGFGIKRSCGLHIHLNALDKTDDDVKRFIRFYMLFEPYLFVCLPPSRQNNHYCQKMNGSFTLDDFDKLSTLDYSYYKTDSRLNHRKRDKYDSARYYALNVHSYFYRGTLEFRMFNGTLSSDKIIKWVGILHNLYKLGFTLSDDRLLELESYNDDKLKTYFFKYVLKGRTIQSFYNSRVDRFSAIQSFIRPTRRVDNVSSCLASEVE